MITNTICFHPICLELSQYVVPVSLSLRDLYQISLPFLKDFDQNLKSL